MFVCILTKTFTEYIKESEAMLKIEFFKVNF